MFGIRFRNPSVMGARNQSVPSFRERIATDPEILGGRPVVKGTRVSVSLILNLSDHGYTFDRITRAYPNLTEEDVQAAMLSAGARLEPEGIAGSRILSSGSYR
jgi:uncharacterized protein (DUF433 family)